MASGLVFLAPVLCAVACSGVVYGDAVGRLSGRGKNVYDFHYSQGLLHDQDYFNQAGTGDNVEDREAAGARAGTHLDSFHDTDLTEEGKVEREAGVAAGAAAAHTREPLQCPPPVKQMPEDSCRMAPCTSDRHCHGHGHGHAAAAREQLQCCYNGCVYTCLVAVKPAPVFDWVVEPKRTKSGRGWLIDKPAPEPFPAEDCSGTVFQDESPLMCPHGYVCHIDDPGEPDRGAPSRGKCILEEDNPKQLHLHHYQVQTDTASPNAGCKWRGTTYETNEIFKRNKHICLCSGGGVVRCSVAHWSHDEEGDVFMSVRDALRQYTPRRHQGHQRGDTAPASRDSRSKKRKLAEYYRTTL